MPNIINPNNKHNLKKRLLEFSTFIDKYDRAPKYARGNWVITNEKIKMKMKNILKEEK